jgi:hypothetical protein
LTASSNTSPTTPSHALETGRIPMSKEKWRDRSSRQADNGAAMVAEELAGQAKARPSDTRG